MQALQNCQGPGIWDMACMISDDCRFITISFEEAGWRRERSTWFSFISYYLKFSHTVIPKCMGNRNVVFQLGIWLLPHKELVCYSKVREEWFGERQLAVCHKRREIIPYQENGKTLEERVEFHKVVKDEGKNILENKNSLVAKIQKQ